jgi:phosphatidate cytidylyltransferase
MLRVASAAVLVAVLVTTIWYLPPWATVVLVAVVAAAAGAELALMAGRIGAGVPPVFVGAASTILSLAFVLSAQAGTGLSDIWAAVLLCLVIVAGVVTLAVGPPEPATITRAAVMVLAPVYVGLPCGAVAWVQAAGGPAATSWLLAMIAVSDSAQYYTGRAFGRRKLAPSISPAKTVEGAIGGLVAAGLAGAVLGRLCLPALSSGVAAGLALALACCGIAGDLFESLLKRSAGVKDSSALIPGHGGMLDRIDSHLFAAPVFYLFLRYFAS